MKPTASQENRAKTMESGNNSPKDRASGNNVNSASGDKAFEIQMDQLHVVEQTVTSNMVKTPKDQQDSEPSRPDPNSQKATIGSYQAQYRTDKPGS
jgi:hypothetical protein